MDALLQDVRYGFRMLARSPGFAAVVVLSLALGIGANTAIFSLIDGVLLKMLPVSNPQELVLLGDAFSCPAFNQIRERNQTLSGLLAFAGVFRFSVATNGRSGLAQGQMVSGNYYSVLGIKATLGRTLSAEDDRIPGGHPVAVISYSYWKQRFGLDSSVVGKAITINSTPFTIIGVTPPEFFGLRPGGSPDISVPIMMQPQMWKDPGVLLNASDVAWLNLVGRLKPNVPEQQARADLDVIYRQVLTSLDPEEGPKHSLKLTPASKGLSDLRQQFSQPLLVLMGVVGLVLLIACANVANLLLARATARQREISVRLALGAGQPRLIRQLLTESMLLAVLGGGVGLLFALWAKKLLLSMLSSGPSPVVLALNLDSRILAFTAVVSLLTGLLFGLAPAFRATRLDLGPALKENARSLSSRGPRFGLGKALMVWQVALSLVLLIGAGLFIRTLQKLNSFYPGFSHHRVLLFSVDPTLIGYQDAQVANLYKQLLERVKAIPGVQSASLTWCSPMGGMGRTGIVSVPGYTARSDSQDLVVNKIPVAPMYFETLRIPLLMGRDFRPQDSQKALRVAIINQTMARHYFLNDSPIGRQFGFKGLEARGQIEIVGVVQDSKNDSLREETPRLVYLPFLQDELSGMTFVVRTAGSPTNLVRVIRHEVQATDKNLPMFDVKTLTQQVDETVLQERLVATLSSVFGLLALLLASVGLYGLMSYAVVRRTNEIGIRMALGAQRGDMLWLVLRETLLLVVIGVAVGLPVAVATARLISSQLFGLKPTDPLTITVATLLLLAVSTLAGYLPAKRASQVDPLVALRYE